MDTSNNFFTFENLLDNIGTNEEKKATMDKYMKNFNVSPDTPLEKHPFYKDYLSKFNTDWDLLVDDGMDFLTPSDWDLLQRLVYGSFSSAYKVRPTKEWLDHPTEKLEVYLNVTVRGDNQSATKSIDELWFFQINRLVEIYLEEQINIVLMGLEDEKEISDMRKAQIAKFNREKEILQYSVKLNTDEEVIPEIVKRITQKQ